MAPRQRVASSGSQQSPSRPPESQIEVLYNTAVQSFVRRDHVKTQAILSRLLALFKQKKGNTKSVWYDLSSDHGRIINGDGTEREGEASGEEIEEWIIKTLKLSISSLTSLYTDPPTSTTALPSELADILPPNNPDKLLNHLLSQCQQHITLPLPTLLPPQIISTLLLASLKLKPDETSLNFAHHLSEEWFTALPDEFILSISANTKSTDMKKRRKSESAKEGYLKVVEIFVGQVLAREGEWEMARGFLDGENVMGAKRKEILFKHLRAMQSTPVSIPTPSPSSSLVLPSNSSSSSSRTVTRASRSGSEGSSSTSSSSSERTARPNQISQIGLNTYSKQGVSRDKGKGKGKSQSVEDVNEIQSPKSTGQNITRDLSKQSQSSPPTRVQQILRSTLSFLPPSLSKRLNVLFGNNLSYLLAIPLPVILLITLIIRRRRRNIRSFINTPNSQTLLSLSNSNNIQDVRNRLRLVRARQQGWYTWFMYYINWWIKKFIGVWNLGTTITYV